MSSETILVIDEGTTGTRALVVDRSSSVRGQAYTEFTQHHPGDDRVEHDAEEIWEATRRMIDGALTDAGMDIGEMAAIGITNQRATTVVWDRATGDPVAPAIVWQDTRTGPLRRRDAGRMGRSHLLPDRVGAGARLFVTLVAMDSRA